MKKLLFMVLFVFSCLAVSGDGFASVSSTMPQVKVDEVEHGGGCRKDSPAGKCCHMETKTGTVHCH